MIQELLGSGAGLLGGERKISIPSEGFLQTSLSPCPSLPSLPTSRSSSSSTATSTTATTTASSNPENQNLRCPRCDSTNTKFCYYNNYNLTQPRHFCKTCRRYWTKGGALRNVPIGGGCRKNKAASNISTSAGKSPLAAKLKTSFSTQDIRKPSLLANGFDNELSSSNHAFLWSPPQNSHILSLLKASRNPSPGLLSSDLALKSGVPTISLDSYRTSQAPSSFGVSSAFWRNNQQPNGFAKDGEAQNMSGIQELFQRLKSSTGSYYYGNHQPMVLSNNAIPSSSHNASSILELDPITGGDFSFLNSPFSWSDVATPSGAYP